MARNEKKFDIDSLEERVAPSSLNLGSLADGVGNLMQGGDSLSTGHIVGGNSTSAGSGDSGSLSTGHILGGNDFANGNGVDASHTAAGNSVMPTTNPSVGVSPNVSTN